MYKFQFLTTMLNQNVQNVYPVLHCACVCLCLHLHNYHKQKPVKYIYYLYVHIIVYNSYKRNCTEF